MRAQSLFILHMPPPIHGASMVGKYIYDSRLIKNKFNPIFINLSTSTNINDIGNFSIRKVREFVSLITRICKTIKNNNIQIVYITPSASGIAFLKDLVIVELLKLLNMNIVLHYHNKGVALNTNKFIYNILYKFFFRNIKIILLSELLYEDIDKYVCKKNVYYCANGIPSIHFIENKKYPKVPNILFLSNLLVSKGVYVLLDALKILKEKGYQFKCYVIGSESKEINQDSFEKAIIDKGLSHLVKYCGHLYNAEKEVYYDQADIFVLPTFNDCFPLVLLEAMQHSLPCIASNEGAIPSIIDDKLTGFIIEKGDSVMLANKIEILINNPNLRNSMGNAGYKKFQSQYTIKQFEKNFVEILTKIKKDYDSKH